MANKTNQFINKGLARLPVGPKYKVVMYIARDRAAMAVQRCSMCLCLGRAAPQSSNVENHPNNSISMYYMNLTLNSGCFLKNLKFLLC